MVKLNELCWIKVGDETARVTSLVRYVPQTISPEHQYPLGDEILVLFRELSLKIVISIIQQADIYAIQMVRNIPYPVNMKRPIKRWLYVSRILVAINMPVSKSILDNYMFSLAYLIF